MTQIWIFSVMPLSLDILQLNHSRPRRSIQSLFGFSTNQVESSSVQKLTKGFVVKSRIGNYLLHVANGCRSD
jgi:hypothetical protein